jgi:hypothetical protein
VPRATVWDPTLERMIGTLDRSWAAMDHPWAALLFVLIWTQLQVWTRICSLYQDFLANFGASGIPCFEVHCDTASPGIS